MPAKLTQYQRGHLAGIKDATLYRVPRTPRLRGTYAQGYAAGYQEAQPLWIERLAIHHYDHSIYKAHKGSPLRRTHYREGNLLPGTVSVTHEVVLHDDGTWLLERSPWHSNHCRSQRIYFLRWLRRLWSSVAPAEQVCSWTSTRTTTPPRGVSSATGIWTMTCPLSPCTWKGRTRIRVAFPSSPAPGRPLLLSLTR
jgi:hypothetical protein